MVVGMQHVAATNAAARIIFDEQMWRPGCTSVAAIGSRLPSLFRKGRLGGWGMFNSWAMPQIQVLNVGVIAVHTVFLDLVRVA